MLTPRRLLRRLRALLTRGRLDRELDAELDFHLAMNTESRERRGELHGAARLAAERELGAVLQIKDQVRDTRGVRPVEEFLTDLRVAVRGLMRKPSFTAASLTTFALGVGGVAAVFGAVHGILLTPLPFGDPDRLVVAWEYDQRRAVQQEASPGNFLDWRARTTGFEALAGIEPFGLDWISPEGPITLATWLVSEGFFDLFRVRPLLGRSFRPDEHQPGRGQAVVLGHALWQRVFGGDSGVVGRILTLDGRPYEVVGVMPRDFDIPYGNDAVWAPKVLAGWEATSRTSPFYSVMGRLKDGVTLEQAQADIARVAAQLAQEYPQTNGHIGARLVPLPEQVVGGARTALLILLGAVGLVMLVAAANIISLQLARALDRAREFSVRAALGAGRGRMVRQLITENLLLAVLGSGLGFGLAVAGLAVIRRLAPPELPRADQLQADGLVLLVAFAVGLLTAVVSGLVPAISAARSDPTKGLGAAGRSVTTSPTARRLRAVLVTSQFALALVLLVGAGLLLRSFVALLNEDRGFRTDRILVMVTQAWGFYTTPPDRAEYVRQAVARLEALPGVEAVGVSSAIPLSSPIGAEQGRIAIVGRPVDPNQTPEAQVAITTGGFFRSLAIPLRRGRLFTPDDRQGTAPVAIVNDAFVRRYLPQGEAIGRRVAVTLARQPGGDREIVGVVADVRRDALHEAARPTVYLPHAQAPTGAVGFLIRTAGNPDAMLDQAKQVVWSLNASMPVSEATTMERLVGESLRERRFLLALLGAFALLGLGLAATGIFGVMSYVTGERTREIGVRMAFGADRGRVQRMVLRDGGRLAGAGIVLGVGGALFATRLVERMLYGVRPLDPITFGGGALLLLAVALLATWIPAFRASRLDPVEALRSE
ncbi:MAG TPA: ABC transporter permease [Gemmatimonadales bacterium]